MIYKCSKVIVVLLQQMAPHQNSVEMDTLCALTASIPNLVKQSKDDNVIMQIKCMDWKYDVEKPSP